MNVDFFFTYKYTLRFLLINKLGFLKNSYNIPCISKLFFFFFLNKLKDIDDIQIYNNIYLFKFFFGKTAFLSKTKKFYLLGTWYYNFNVQLIINNKKDIYFILFFFFNEIFINIDKNLLNFGFLNKKFNIFYFLFKDLNVYSELKTNTGLFNIKKPLTLHIYFKGCDLISNKIFINSLLKFKQIY